jgi:putative membrane protein
MKKNIVNVVLMGLVLVFTSCETKKNEDSKDAAEDANKEQLDSDLKKDSEFAVEAADGGLFEVQLATLALTKGTAASVKQFAQMMVDDHAKANNELKTLSGQKGISLPDVISEKCQKKYYDLDQKNKGSDFDKEYIDLMVKDHKDDIDKFEKEADKGNDAEIKSWASRKLGALRHHLAEAERIQDELKKNK